MTRPGCIAILALLPLLVAPVAHAQRTSHEGAAPRSTFAAPAGQGRTVLAQPVARPVPGVLSDAPPPRYDGLALGHAQFANEPPPGTGRQRGRDATDADGLRSSSSGYATDQYGSTGQYGGYAVPYPVDRGNGQGGRPTPFGSSASLDGD